MLIGSNKFNNWFIKYQTIFGKQAIVIAAKVCENYCYGYLTIKRANAVLHTHH